MDEAWRALSHGIRRDILLLVKERERTAGEIAAVFAITRPAVSQHLGVLRAAGLVEERREGTKRLYRLQTAPLHALRQVLATLMPTANEVAELTKASTQIISRLDARPDAAFRLFADPEQLQRWKGPLHGRFLAVEAPHRLTLALGWQPENAGSARVELQFNADGTGTRLELTHEGPGADGWQHYLPRLECVARGWDPGPDDRL